MPSDRSRAKRRWAILLAATAVVLAATTRDFLSPIGRLFEEDWSYNLAQFSQPMGGETLLRPEIQAALALVRTYQVTRVNLGDGIGKDDYLYRRSAAALYPTLLDSEARLYLLLPSDGLGPGCELVGQQGDVRLVDCP